MGIEEVKKEILDNARDQAKEILKDADKEKKGILASAETRISQIKEKLDSDSDKQIAQHKAMMAAESMSIAKKKKLAIERATIGEVFEDAMQNLEKMSPKKREQHLKKLMAVKFDFSKVYCSKKDASLLKKHKPIEREMLGGVMLENKEGNVRVDLSYETLLALVRQEKVAEITKILF